MAAELSKSGHWNVASEHFMLKNVPYDKVLAKQTFC